MADLATTSEPDATGLIAKIDALLNKLSKAGDGDGDITPGNKVPFHRFEAKRLIADASVEALQEMRAEVTALSTGFDTKLTAAKELHATQIGAQAATNAEDMTLRDEGFDGAGRTALRDEWGRQPEATRGDNPVAWWKGQTDALALHRKDPDKNDAPGVPRTLQAYLPEPEKPAAPAKKQAGQPAQNNPFSVIVANNLNTDNGVVQGQRQTQAEKIAAAAAAGDHKAYQAALRGE